MRAATGWPIALAGVLGVTVIANVFLLYAANDRNAAVVEPDYYRKAVAWDSTAAQLGVDAALGWSIDARFDPIDVHGDAQLHVRVTDRDGMPLAGARIVCTGIHNLDAGHRPEADGTADTLGEAALPFRHVRPGLWELRFVVTHGTDRFTGSLRRDAAPGPRATGS
jgi:FixH